MNESDKFPTVEQVRIKIQKLKGIEWPTYVPGDNVNEYIGKVSDVFTEEFNILPDVVQLIKSNKFGFKIFRVRAVEDLSDINLICEHSYPPIGITSLNRCNFPKYPVFYGSNNAMTALIEVVKDRPLQNKKYCISSWRIYDTDSDITVQPYLFGDLHADNAFKSLQETLNNKVKSIFENKLSDEQEEGMKMYLKFMADTFTNDDSYTISAFFANRQLYAPHNLRTEILIYPSVQTLNRGVNFAIHPNFVDSKMHAIRFYIVEINKVDKVQGAIDLNFTSYGVLERSQIIWKDITPTDPFYREYIKEDFNHDGDFKFIENKE
jgi:hypothetical protein